MKPLLALLIVTPQLLWADSTINGKTVECYCTDKTGSRVELGQTICLEVGGRMFMAQCQMSLNVPMPNSRYLYWMMEKPTPPIGRP